MKEFEISQKCEYTMIVQAENEEEARRIGQELNPADMEENWESLVVQECL